MPVETMLYIKSVMLRVVANLVVLLFDYLRFCIIFRIIGIDSKSDVNHDGNLEGMIVFCLHLVSNLVIVVFGKVHVG